MATDSLMDNRFSAQPIYLSDLSRCVPDGALSPEPAPGRWRSMSYETDALSGVMLMGGPETAAPEVRYPLGVSGWHAVSVGFYGDRREDSTLLVRLSGEETFSILTHRTQPTITWAGHSVQQISEIFWRVTDLTGQDLVMLQQAWRVAQGEGPGTQKCSIARIAYIKVVPLSAVEVEAVQADRRRTDTRRLFAHNDAHGIHFSNRPTTAEEIRRRLECFRDTDFARIYWEAGSGDFLKYFTKIGRLQTYDTQGDFQRQGDRMHGESWRVFRAKGIDPFEAALEHAHDVGLELHASYRVAGFHYPPPLDYNSQGPTFYDYHPELRGIDRDGNRTPRMSYSYPAVRRLVVSLLREMAGYDIDGVCLLYNRRPPLVEYEPPVVDGFKAEYGEDPRNIEENDPRWLTYRARTLTQFHREVREAMDDEARKQGRRKIEVSAIVMRDEQENLMNAMDLKAWIDEGLVDTIIPYTSEPGLDSMTEAWADLRSAEYFVSLTRGTSCRLALNLMPRGMSSEAYRRKAAALYSAGVENLFFWDCASSFTSFFGGQRRLGHRDEVETWSRAGEPAPPAPAMEIRKLGDWDLRYATPG